MLNEWRKQCNYCYYYQDVINNYENFFIVYYLIIRFKLNDFKSTHIYMYIYKIIVIINKIIMIFFIFTVNHFMQHYT